MKVILLADVPKVGNRYDVKDLKEGYAQNVLISKGLAILATKAELAKLDDMKEKMERKRQEEIKIFKELVSSINNKSIKIKVKANDKGNLFKSVSPKDVIDAIKKDTGIEIEEKSLVMEHIKVLGSHKVTIKKGDQKGECEVIVEAL